jgi:hypothetical protein
MSDVLPVSHTVLMDVVRYLNRDADETIQNEAMKAALHSHCVQKDVVLCLDGVNFVFVVNDDNADDYGYSKALAENYNMMIKQSKIYAGDIGPIIAEDYPKDIYGEESNIRYNMELGEEI